MFWEFGGFEHAILLKRTLSHQISDENKTGTHGGRDEPGATLAESRSAEAEPLFTDARFCCEQDAHLGRLLDWERDRARERETERERDKVGYSRPNTIQRLSLPHSSSSPW